MSLHCNAPWLIESFVMLGIVTLPAIASAKPVRDSHNVTPAKKAHFTKLHSGR